MTAGVSTACLYPMETEKALRSLAEADVKNMEIFLNTHCELYDPYLGDMLDCIREYGLNITSVHPYTCGVEPMMLFTAYERRLNDMIDYYRRFFEFMGKVGAKYFVLHGNKPENTFPMESEFENFARLQTAAREMGVEVLRENVARCTSGKLSYMLEMKRYLGDMASFVLDTKQAVRAGEDPVEVARALGDSIKHIHYSESGKKGDCLPCGCGDGDPAVFFEALKSVGFDGAVILELYADGYTGGTKALAENSRKIAQYI